MKRFITYIIILFITFVKAQTVVKPILMVEYTFYDNFRHSQHTSTLVMNQNESIFRTIIEDKKAELKGNNMFIGSKRVDTYNYTNKHDNQIVSYESIDSEPVAILENIPQLKWNLDFDDIKKIDNYDCNKATVDFRGRSYVVWYTREIPSFFGPWKFSGLPGLILEIIDSTNTYHWVVSKIRNNNIPKIYIPYEEAREITLVEANKLREDNLERLRARVRSKFPKGTEFSVPKNSRQGLERIYEWEDEQ